MARSTLCPLCSSTLRHAVERRLGGGVLVRPALVHDGAARTLVHHLKYRGMVSAADVLAAEMAAVVPPGTTHLIPVPRVLLRMWRYGIDPAAALASALSRIIGIPVANRSPAGAVLVDDVLTTGATLSAAARALPGSLRAITATGPAHRSYRR
jgi:predicted amidophosphoribosyltransferase